MFTDPNVATVDDLYRQIGGHLRGRNYASWRELCTGVVWFFTDGNERLSAGLVSQYLSVNRGS